MAPSLLWFLIAAALLLLTLLGIDTDGLLLMAGLAALLLTLVTILLPLLPTLLQVLLFAGLVVGGYLLLRRWARQQREGPLPQSAAAERAEVISGFDAEGEGRVRWQGQSWAAVNLAPEMRLSAGTPVTVMGRDGTRLQVLPRGVSGAPAAHPDRLEAGSDQG
jgi:membrane protein implicated in regulation of membrane protease activity